VIAHRHLLPILVALAYSVAPAQTLVTTIPVGSNPVAIALNSATGKVYVVNQGSNNVTVIDPTTNRTVNVPVGAAPVALAVNSPANTIYVSNGDAGSVTIIDGATNRTATVITGNGAGAIAVNPVTNKIYVANGLANTVTVIDGSTQHTTNIGVGRRPVAIAINSATNKIYVADYAAVDVSAINGADNSVTRIPVGTAPQAIAVNETTNHIYVANYGSSSVSVIDGVTNASTPVSVPATPFALAIDSVRNKIVVASVTVNQATILDGATLATTTVDAGLNPFALDVDPLRANVYIVDRTHFGTVTVLNDVSAATSSAGVGSTPSAVAVDSAGNRIYVANSDSNNVSVLTGGPSAALEFVPVPPCRIVDTRQPQGPFGGPYLSGGTSRGFAIPQSACNIPASAAAYALNVTVAPKARSLGYLTLWPAGEPQPVVSTLNSPDGRVKANAAIVPAGASGAVNVYVSDATNVILDVDGYFQAAGQRTLQFYSVPLCRVVDTRAPDGPLGGPYLRGGTERDFPLLAGNCQLPQSAVAYSLNFTVVPVNGPLGYLTVWPAGSPQPIVSTLNNPTATIVANAAIVPAGDYGAIAAFADRDTHLIADVNGYFAPPGGGLALHPLPPCRVLDTRLTGGAFSGARNPPVPVATSPCNIPPEAQQYLFNATVIPEGPLGYLTLWPDGRPATRRLHAQRSGRAGHVEHGDPRQQRRPGRRLCSRDDIFDPRHRQLLRAGVTQVPHSFAVFE
jgi:YVTN family beta-propeller protein